MKNLISNKRGVVGVLFVALVVMTGMIAMNALAGDKAKLSDDEFSLYLSISETVSKLDHAYVVADSVAIKCLEKVTTDQEKTKCENDLDQKREKILADKRFNLHPFRALTETKNGLAVYELLADPKISVEKKSEIANEAYVNVEKAKSTPVLSNTTTRPYLQK